jgi:hypothetical protein
MTLMPLPAGKANRGLTMLAIYPTILVFTSVPTLAGLQLAFHMSQVVVDQRCILVAQPREFLQTFSSSASDM